MRKILLILFLLFSFISFAQVTSASVIGQVRNGALTINGANVTLTHFPTNTTYKTRTNESGNFQFENLIVGGPYEITITKRYIKDYYENEIELTLGENDLKTIFVQNKDDLEITEVKTNKNRNSFQNFSGNSFNEKLITNLPNINRNIQDITKLIPQSANNSFSGTNFRYNNVTIDGAINNDAIGFSTSLGGQSSTSGTPGSSTRSNSISIEAIKDIQAYLTPFDVKFGNFLGGSVNIVTQSGTNKLSGSIYSYGRNASLTGPNNVGDGARIPNDFSDLQLGFKFGMPFIKDKLFFFSNVEITKRNDPLFNNAGDIDAKGNLNSLIDAPTAQSIANSIATKYGYDIGSFNNFTNYSKSTKIFNKLDFKINSKNSISIRNNYVISEATNLERDVSNFRFSSLNFIQKNTAISSVFELKSELNSNLSNSFVVGYSTIKDYRNPTSENTLFPQVEIGFNGGTILFGNDREATVFNLKQTTTEITNNLIYKSGNHKWLFGTHNELYNIDYGFVNALNGRISYKSLSDFNNSLPSRVRGTYSFNGTNSADLFNSPYSKFKINLFSGYIQDEIKIGTKLKITPGIRIDYTILPVKPNQNAGLKSAISDPNFGTTYQYTPIKNLTNDFFGKPSISPRLGFTYNVNENNSLVIRGGVGVFTGRIPFAWLGYAYYNDGVGYGSYDKNNLTAAEVATAGDPLLNNGLTNYQGQTSPKVQLDLIDNDFKTPQSLKNSLAFDYTKNGYKFTFEGIYNKVLNDLKFQQINKTDNPTYFTYDTKREMPIYSTNINSNFSNVYLLSNTNEGYSYNLTAQLSKSYEFGLNFMAAYTYGSAKDISNGIRNSMESNWQLNQSLTPNNPQLTTSNFEIKHRIITNIGYNIKLGKNNTLTTNLFINGQSGNPFTWGYLNTSIANSGQSAGLAYIFKDATETAKYVGNTSGVASADAAQQVADYESFISKNEYLNSRRGKFTERNAAKTPWNTQIDLKIIDELRFKAKNTTHSIQISLSIINVGNLISNDWGKSFYVSNTFNSTASIGLTKNGNLPASSPNAGDPTFTFIKPSSKPYNIDQFTSRFQGQIGLIYSF
jgi:Carboxypeptidase regulatory-like domain